MHQSIRKGASGELWGITTYFNPIRYPNKLMNLERFASRIRRQGMKLLIVELAFGDHEHEVDTRAADKIIRLRSETVLWQRERLLNIAVTDLPPSCDKVVWLDADLIFINNDWVSRTADLLDRFMVVQPFQNAWWLDRSSTVQAHNRRASDKLAQGWEQKSERRAYGAAYVSRRFPDQMLPYGHTGFAWAFRRHVLDECGFYDRLIVGGNDYIISGGILGLGDSEDFQESLSLTLPRIQVLDALQWIERFSNIVQDSVFFTEGSVYHMWHGEWKNRRYLERYQILTDASFDPLNDIAIDEERVWRWNSSKVELHKKVLDYFVQRRED